MVDNFSVDSNGKVQKHFVHEMLLFELPKLTRTSINGNRFYSTPDGNKYPSITTVVGFHTCLLYTSPSPRD